MCVGGVRCWCVFEMVRGGQVIARGVSGRAEVEAGLSGRGAVGERFGVCAVYLSIWAGGFLKSGKIFK